MTTTQDEDGVCGVLRQLDLDKRTGRITDGVRIVRVVFTKDISLRRMKRAFRIGKRMRFSGRWTHDVYVVREITFDTDGE